MNDYRAFLASKHTSAVPAGINVSASDIHPALRPYQNVVTRRALQMGRYALFEECGLGKTLQELEWARHVAAHTGRPVLILTTWGVVYQFLEEGLKWAIDVRYAADQTACTAPGIYITNYDRLHLFDLSQFGGVVLDESSILKAYMGTTKRALIDRCAAVPFRLCGTATPAPNDHLELGNHAEFLGVMPSNEMIARWFINDSRKAGNYRLKGYAERDFWRWLTSWAVCISHPRDLGPDYDLPGYDLPPLRIHEHLVDLSAETYERAWAEGRLLPDANPSSTALGRVKRETLLGRVAKAREIVATLPDSEYIAVWCELNDESSALAAAFPDALEVAGHHKSKLKDDRLKAFSQAQARMMVTKADIAGFGLNWQHVGVHIDASPTYSFEKFYQKIRRSYRYGRQGPVDVHLIFTETLANVPEVLREKQARFAEMQASMNEAMRTHGLFRDGNPRGLTSAEGDKPIRIPDWLRTKEAA